jgi:predicted nucleic acid-binding protein
MLRVLNMCTVNSNKFVDYIRRRCPNHAAIETLVQDAIEISAAVAKAQAGHLVVL